MNIQLEKANIIQLIQQSDDVDLIKTLKSLLEYSTKKQAQDIIPEWHKTIVRKRLDETKENPGDLLTWDDIMSELNK